MTEMNAIVTLYKFDRPGTVSIYRGGNLIESKGVPHLDADTFALGEWLVREGEAALRSAGYWRTGTSSASETVDFWQVRFSGVQRSASSGRPQR